MAQLTHHVPMDPPKLFCLPARPLMCGLAAFGIIRSFIQFWMSHRWGIEISHIFVFILDCLLLYGAYKNDVFALKWSQRVVLACVIVAIIRFMIYPVVFASFVASGLSSNLTGVHSDDLEILKNVTTPEEHFVLGMVAGFSVEFATTLSIGVECLKYLLVHRLWEYAKATEAEHAPQRYSMP